MADVPIEQVVLRHIRDIADFPEPGIQFKDFTPLFADPVAFATVVDDVAARYARGTDRAVDAVVGIEARGFVLGAAVAYRLGVGFVPVRKAGKLPGATLRQEYTLEYGSAVLELHQDALTPGRRVVIVDDVLATGGTAAAACRLVEQTGATLVGLEIVLELTFLPGRDQLAGQPLHVLASV